MNKDEPAYKEFENWYNKGWSECQPLDQKSIKELPEFPGVYEVRTKNYSFPRLRGMSSVLYIGCAEQREFKIRIKSHAKGRGRSGKRIQRIAVELKKELEFRFKVELSAKQAEKDALKNYEHNHLELPPCNHNIPR